MPTISAKPVTKPAPSKGPTKPAPKPTAPAKPAAKVTAVAGKAPPAKPTKPAAAAARPPFKPTNKPAAKPTPAPAAEPTGEGETGVDQSIEGMLEQLDQTWQDSEEKTGFDKVPEGKYQVRLRCVKADDKPDEKIGLNYSGSGRPQCTFECTIVNGPFVNRKMWKRDGLDGEESIGWFKGGLSRLGVESPKSMKELPGILAQIDGTFAQVTVKHKDDFLNIYFDKALDSSEVETEGLAEAPAAEGGEPVAEEAAAPRAWKKGEKCQADFSGDWYTGVVQVTNKNGTIKIKFDDDQSVQDIDASLVAEFTPDEGGDPAATEGEGEAAPEPEAEGGEQTAPTGAVTISFEETAITEAMQVQIQDLATQMSFDPNAYATWGALIADIAEYCDIKGEYKSPQLLIKKVSDAAKAAAAAG